MDLWTSPTDRREPCGPCGQPVDTDGDTLRIGSERIRLHGIDHADSLAIMESGAEPVEDGDLHHIRAGWNLGAIGLAPRSRTLRLDPST